MTTLFVVALFSIWPFSNEVLEKEIKELHKEAKIQFKVDPDSAIALTQLALSKSQKASDSYTEAMSYAMLGSFANKQGKPALAIIHFLNSLQVYKDLDNPESWTIQANICLTMGKIFRHHHKTQEAIDHYKQGIDLALQSKNKKIMVKLLHNLAVAHRTGKDYGAATHLLMQKLDFIDLENVDELLHTYNELGLEYQSLKEYDKARQWFEKILETETNPEPSFFRGQALHNLANVFNDEGNPKEARAYFERALVEFEPLAQPRDLLLTYQDMASLLLREGQSEMALVYAEKATPLLDDLPDIPEYYDQYDLLSHCIEEKNPREALNYSRLYEKKQKVFNKTQNDLIAQTEGYKLDLVLANHEQKLRQQAQQKKLTYIVIALLIFSLIIYIYMDYRKRKYRLKLLDSLSFFIKDTNLLNKL